MDTIFVDQIEFYGFHGASDEEQKVGHRYVVDLEMTFDTTVAGLSDNLTDTINYFEASKLLVEIGTTKQYRLLEALAADFARKAASSLNNYCVYYIYAIQNPLFNIFYVAWRCGCAATWRWTSWWAGRCKGRRHLATERFLW